MAPRWGVGLLGVVVALMGAGDRLAGQARQLDVPPLVGDGMVIQRGVPVPIRGEAAPGAEVRVTLEGGEEQVTRADASGAWTVRLGPRDAGGPYDLVIASGGDRLRIGDVMVGDVWIASGQSNMEWKVADSRDAASEIAAADDRAIRYFRVPRSWSDTPKRELVGGAWEVSDAAHVGGHSAVAYFFARDLREHVDVPIGIVDNSWGGARIEPYMSAAALGLDARRLDEVMEIQRAYEARLLDNLRRRIGGLPESDRGMENGRAVWADPALDDSGWSTLVVPARWESVGYEGLNGVAWYRRTFELTEAEAAAPVHLGVGMIDDSDITWVNGREVGRMAQAWNQARRYRVPPDALRAGENVVAVRVEDTGGGGGIAGSGDLLYLETAAGRRPLDGAWRFRVGAVSADFESDKNQVATLLYNQMVHPLVDFPIAGVLWYQGESNAYPEDAFAYRRHFTAMIRDWREAWGLGDLPFLWVQLANYMAPGDGTEPSDWAMLRESQSAALALPATAQVVAIDLGEADDIHPRNKQDVGARLARAARAVAYGQDVVHSGPVYAGHRIREDGRIAIRFDHVDGGLVAGSGADADAAGAAGGNSAEVGGFVVAGTDGRFVPARAVIDGDEVVVWSEAVPAPVAVRYAWADNPSAADLYNREGLPATPFRTDRDPSGRVTGRENGRR